MEKNMVYLDQILNLLESEDFFNKSGVFMDKDVLSECLLDVIDSNYEEYGEYLITPDQLSEAVEKTTSLLIEETFNDMIDDGSISMTGINSEGEFVYKANTDLGDDENPDKIN